MVLLLHPGDGFLSHNAEVVRSNASVIVAYLTPAIAHPAPADEAWQICARLGVRLTRDFVNAQARAHH
jgi:hypothetical protein